MSEKLVDGFHVYGASASAKFEIVANRGGVSVLAVDIAGRVPSRDSFDWDKKISIQVTDREMPQLMCAVLGITPTFDLRNHGLKKTNPFPWLTRLIRESCICVLLRGRLATVFQFLRTRFFTLGS